MKDHQFLNQSFRGDNNIELLDRIADLEGQLEQKDEDIKEDIVNLNQIISQKNIEINTLVKDNKTIEKELK